MYKKVKIKHVDKRTKVIKGLDFPFKKRINYENIEMKILLKMIDFMDFKIFTWKAKHKSNLDYMKHKYTILDLQTGDYKGEVCETVNFCLYILEPYIIGYKFFAEDGNCYE